MNLILVGTNHKYSPIEVRERIAFSKKSLREAIQFLKERGILEGAVILSTCNRVEIYASSNGTETGTGKVKDFISRYHEIDNERISPFLYTYKDKEALKHLFSVTCGLDSMILGETQISGQVRSSFLESKDAGYTDELLDGVFHSALSFANRIHRETEISEGKMSIGSVAIDFIKGRLGALSGKNILIIGVGKVTELVLRYLEREEPRVVFISNRTFDKAKEMARRIGAHAVRFDSLKHFLKKADIVITATASPHTIIKKETIKEATDNKLFIMDLALPRDVDPQVGELDNVELFSLKDLDVAIKQNLGRKGEEAKKVKNIIDMETERLWPEVFPEKAVSFGKRTYRIGTRNSPLALRQVEEILTLLKRFYSTIYTETVGIETHGDRDKSTPISQIEGSDFFTKEIDDALLCNKVDFAVHSAKDLADRTREGLSVAAITESIDPYDVLVSKTGLRLDELPYGARIGTSSLRRKEALKGFRPDFQIVDIRGNIEERLKLLDDNAIRNTQYAIRKLDAIVIAAAGLVRLGLERRITQRISLDILRPHPLQGALAVIARKEDTDLIDLLSVLDRRRVMSL